MSRRQTSIIIYNDENAKGPRRTQIYTPKRANTITLGHTTYRLEDHTQKKSTLPTAHTLTLTIPPHAHNHQGEMKTNHRLAHFCILRKEKGKEGRESPRREGRRRRRRAQGRRWKMPPIERNRGKRSETSSASGQKREELDGGFRGRL